MGKQAKIHVSSRLSRKQVRQQARNWSSKRENK